MKALNISYGCDELQKYDIFWGHNMVNAPIVISVHGGGWWSGDKRKQMGFSGNCYESGCVFATINYRFGQYPEPVEDVALAIKHIQENAVNYAADASKVILHGFSSGAHLAALVSYDNTWLSNVGFIGRPLGFIGLSGVYQFDLVAAQQRVKDFLGPVYGYGNWEVAEPINHVTEDDPPALLIVGEYDTFVGVENTTNFAAKLDAGNVPGIVEIVPGLNHNAVLWQFKNNDQMQTASTSFLASVTEN